MWRQRLKNVGLLALGGLITTGVWERLDADVDYAAAGDYALYLVRDHGTAGKCGIELPKDGSEIIDPRSNEGPRWLRLRTTDGHICDWEIPETLSPVAFQADGPTMDAVSVRCVFEFGDVDGDGDVNLIDAAAVKAHNGQAVTDETCRYDLNTDGRINLIDMAMVKKECR